MGDGGGNWLFEVGILLKWGNVKKYTFWDTQMRSKITIFKEEGEFKMCDEKHNEMPRRKYQCFISSTYEDLRVERARSIETVLEAGQIPAGMEYFEAGRPQKEIIEKWMDESDIIIFLIGGRYGTIDRTTGNSYLEDEYDYAIKKGKPHFSIVLSDAYLERKKAESILRHSNISVYEEENQDRHIIFRDKVCKDENVAIIDTIENIKTVIMRNILNYIQGGRLRGGWMLCRDNKYEDIDEMDLKDRKKILLELLKENFIHTTRGEEETSIINSFCDILQQYNHALEKFIKTMARAVEITLFDEYIEVHNTVNVTYITSENADTGFTYNPWLYEGLESETFKIEELKYNHENVEKSCVEKGKPEYTSNPFYVNNVVKTHIPFDGNKRKHKIKYSTRYRTDYDRYFHEYVFKEFCQFFSLTITLNDRRTCKKDKEYMIKWGMFTPYKTYDHSSQDMLDHNKDRITFNVADLMIPGNGYVITLNNTASGIIKMKNDKL